MPDFAEDDSAERWLSYHELAQLWGCSVNAARTKVWRNRWPRRSPNEVGGRALVCVPSEMLERGRAPHRMTVSDERHLANEAGPEAAEQALASGALITAIREVFTDLIAPLREQLEHERARADRAEARAQAAEAKVRECLETMLRPRGWWRWWFR